MLYNIPDDIAPYLEYIPDDMLEEIITEALRAAIFKRPESQVVEASDNSITQLLEQIKAVIGTGNMQAVTAVQTAIAEPPKKKEDRPIVIQTSDDEELPSDLKDLVSAFAGEMFR